MKRPTNNNRLSCFINVIFYFELSSWWSKVRQIAWLWSWMYICIDIRIHQKKESKKERRKRERKMKKERKMKEWKKNEWR